MKFLVYGAGAVGSTVGGMLAHAGHAVTLVGRNPHMSSIASAGLKISGLWGDYHVKDLQTAEKIPPAAAPDAILLTTKSFDTEKAADVLARRFPQDIPILHLQNGVGNAESLAARVGWPRVVSGMIIIGFKIPLAGCTVVTVSADKIKMGRREGAIDAVTESFVTAFNAAKMPAEAVGDIQTQLWGKVLYNASLNALGGILGVKYGDLLDPHPWGIIRNIIHEAFQVLKTEGQPLAWASPDDYLEHLRTFQVPATFDHKPSLLSDLHHGRRTEIDSINGALAALGRRHGIATPVNDALISIIHALEANAQKGILHPSLQARD